jgi:hypothetical protein
MAHGPCFQQTSLCPFLPGTPWFFFAPFLPLPLAVLHRLPPVHTPPSPLQLAWALLLLTGDASDACAEGVTRRRLGLSLGSHSSSPSSNCTKQDCKLHEQLDDFFMTSKLCQ